MFHIGMWVFRSTYSDIATIYCTDDVECRFVTELHLIREMTIGPQLKPVNVTEIKSARVIYIRQLL